MKKGLSSMMECKGNASRAEYSAAKAVRENRHNFFETGLTVVPKLLSDQDRKLCLNYLEVIKERYKKARGLTGGMVENDKHHPKTFSYYSPLCTEVFLLKLRSEIEKVVSNKLVPSFSYARIYYKGSELERHVDRKHAKFGVSICLDRDQFDWPLVIQDRLGREQEINLSIGDAVIFKGMELEHYRKKFEGNFQTQMFLFYMPAETTDASKFLDGRTSLGVQPTKPNNS